MAQTDSTTNTLDSSGILTGHLEKAWPALLAMVFGVLILYAAGFAQPQALHDTAHDTRHSFAFPCH